MRIFSDLRKLIDEAEQHYKTLNSIAKDEIKEYGAPRPDTCKQINALLYSISNAYDAVDKGLDGEF